MSIVFTNYKTGGVEMKKDFKAEIGSEITVPSGNGQGNTIYKIVEKFNKGVSPAIDKAINLGFRVVRTKETGPVTNTAAVMAQINVIALGDQFFEKNEKEREAIMYHELGHIVFEHSKQSIRGIEDYIKREKEADIYGAIHVGKEDMIKINKKDLLRISDLRNTEPRYQTDGIYKDTVEKEILKHKEKIEMLEFLQIDEVQNIEKQKGVKLIENTKIYKLKSNLDIDIKVLEKNEIIVSEKVVKALEPKEREKLYFYHQVEQILKAKYPKATEDKIKEARDSNFEKSFGENADKEISRINDKLIAYNNHKKSDLTIDKMTKEEKIAINILSQMESEHKYERRDVVIGATVEKLGSELKIDEPLQLLLGALEKKIEHLEEVEKVQKIDTEKERLFTNTYVLAMKRNMNNLEQTVNKENKIESKEHSTIKVKYQSKEQEIAMDYLAQVEKQNQEKTTDFIVKATEEKLKKEANIDKPSELLLSTLQRKKAYLKVMGPQQNINCEKEISGTNKYIKVVKGNLEELKKDNSLDL